MNPASLFRMGGTWLSSSRNGKDSEELVVSSVSKHWAVAAESASKTPPGSKGSSLWHLGALSADHSGAGKAIRMVGDSKLHLGGGNGWQS